MLIVSLEEAEENAQPQDRENGQGRKGVDRSVLEDAEAVVKFGAVFSFHFVDDCAETFAGDLDGDVGLARQVAVGEKLDTACVFQSEVEGNGSMAAIDITGD